MTLVRVLRKNLRVPLRVRPPVSNGDFFLCDEMSQYSVVRGVRLKRKIYRHSLERLLKTLKLIYYSKKYINDPQILE